MTFDGFSFQLCYLECKKMFLNTKKNYKTDDKVQIEWPTLLKAYRI